MEEKKGLEGIGGWLILVAIGIVVSPLRIIAQVLPPYLQIISGDSWDALTKPGSEIYNPLWAPMLIAEILVNSCLIAAWVYIAFLFFRKKAAFPKWYIGIWAFTIIFIIADALVLKLILPDAPVFDPEAVKDLIRIFITALIWVPYILVSKRVKATFVK